MMIDTNVIYAFYELCRLLVIALYLINVFIFVGLTSILLADYLKSKE